MDTFSLHITLRLFLVLFLSLAGRAQDSPCISSCTETASSDSGCSLSDTSCICTSAQFKNSFDQCTTSNCSFENAQIAQQLHAQQCDTQTTSSIGSSITSPPQSSTRLISSASTTSSAPKSSGDIGSQISSASATPTSSGLPASEHHTIPVGTILGTVISTIVLVAVILILWFRYHRRRHELGVERPIARVVSRLGQKDSAIELGQSQPLVTWPYCLPGDPAYESRVSFRPPSVAPGQSPAPIPPPSPGTTTALPLPSPSVMSPPTSGEEMAGQTQWLGTRLGLESADTRLSYPTMSPSPSVQASAWNPRAAPQTTNGLHPGTNS